MEHETLRQRSNSNLRINRRYVGNGVFCAVRLGGCVTGQHRSCKRQSSERLQVVRAVNPGQAYSRGPAWELLDNAQRTVLNNQPRAVNTEKQRRGFQLTPCVPGGTASVET
jgi:hypothetical protein